MSEDVGGYKGVEGEQQHHRPFGPALVLTAEELAVLEEAHTRGLAALPGQPELSGQPELAESQETQLDQVATRTGAADRSSPGLVRDAGSAQARWSLIARGLLTPDGQLPEDTDVGLLLQTLLDVRLAAEALVVVERLLGEGRRDVRLLHLVPQGGVVEDVHPEGLHGLDLGLDVRGLVTSVTEMVVPADARGGDGPEVTADLEDVAGVSSLLPTLLHRPTVLAELTMARPQQEATGHLVALGPRGCWAGPTPAGQGLLRLSPVEPGWVGELVTSWVQGVVGIPGGGTMSG
ncbi:hypothetical protein [Ornithinimicrobium pratense]|uniref:ESX secretion-associated protein EspG n=1 Tax=Ornithinimicrobium pratense TaxID=2593973 RepID=A0A5J6V6L8_9MICO|nr:hypothetical protein [Ornithinimicrobium pratense]QFG68944.1 hypothetical protein FY030_09725 [Ornithinimicrobium pratense]